MNKLDDFLSFALDAAWQAGVLTLGYFQRHLEIVEKADASPVTVADREAEALIRRMIEERFPDHGIIGEEHGTKDPQTGCTYRWVIDPIDGTKSFIHGVPFYTTLLALLRGEGEETESVVGVVNVPALGDLLSAARGAGARLNGRPVRVSDVSDLSRAVVLTTDFIDMEQRKPREKWGPIMERCRFSRTWGDAYGHFLVATGRAEVMIDPILNPHDCAAFPVILEEAGGAYFDWTGRVDIFSGDGISTNGALRGDILKQISS